MASWRDDSPWADESTSRNREWYDTMQVCENGHQITTFAESSPERRKAKCPKCGAKTITACPACQAKIPGYHHVPRVVSIGFELKVPAFCEACGKPYPWTGKENPDEDAASRPLTQHVLPLDVVKGTRGYFEQIVNQANGCYEKGWYDACSVMIRKLVEVLIIAVFEAKGESATIKKDDNFLMLSGLVDAILARPDWNLGRVTKAALPQLKALGDHSAHSRHYMARKPDVDKVLPGLRVAVEDLLHHACLAKA